MAWIPFWMRCPCLGQQHDAWHCHDSGLTLSRKGKKEQMLLGFNDTPAPEKQQGLSNLIG